MAEKRKDTSAGSALIKRTKPNDKENDKAVLTLSNQRSGTQNAIVGTVKRTSALEAPVMQLTGHSGEIYSCEFDSSGELIASAGFDRQIFLWNTYGEVKNYGIIKGHTNAVMEIHWSRDSKQIFSCSADKSVGIFDVKTGERVRKWKGHSAIVNSCQVARRGPEIVVSASDDHTVKVWDPRSKEAVSTFEHEYQATSVCFSDAGDMVYSAGIDNVIKVWDVRKNQTAYTLEGHLDTVTGLRLSPDGSNLLSNSMDNTVRIWDIKPFAANDRCLKVFEGAPHGFEKNLIRPTWSTDGTQIACGSADRTVVIWQVDSKKILYKLPGHKGCVNDVDWHPKEPIVMSASTDKTLFLVNMGRMHTPGKGISSSALPYRRTPPSWVKTTSEEVVDMICKNAKKGLTPSQIGVILRDSYGIPQVRSITGNKVLRILKSSGLAPEVPEDLYHLIKKAVSIRKHLERNRKDKDSKYRLILIESRIHRLARYYKTSGQLPPTWK
ncbi:hypothetical protein G6F46_003050 [Rhizopus delemar]|uniref:Small ribosomal subunit protein uS15 N-terminal domain-containing protein n=3 Tax=Rhizopus TaxID=4842 RepID=A0A9P6YZU9_9FUNG|nr:hypothetical protein G6F55_001525 [Rhizopus delemar]KAG1549244.1 hypothetical protein G6F51_003170 [Rhizopus arrhizus]KAG1523917.1 hypothetical protein G6F52_004621 [Rhizopus delemar]KAG1558687.1 hypothetical protein G6F49_004284 [Rhizopus delemar]KAG1567410.1 hypothetical protein G6F50_008233 [Rhizopus delemar]